jgi:hypothetical protein
MLYFHILLYFRNSTYCLKIKITAKILENEPNLCYNAQSIFIQRLHIAEDGSLVCPHLDFFKDENNELPKVQWYKVILFLKCYFSFPANKIVFCLGQYNESAKEFFQFVVSSLVLKLVQESKKNYKVSFI